MSGGDISAMYIGARIKDAPTPNPPIIRAITRVKNVGAKAEASAEMAYRIAATRNTDLLPNRSLSGPDIIIAKVAVSVKEATDHPSSSFVSPNSGSMNLTTPEMTEASKPMSKPPKATIMAIIAMTYLSDLISNKFLHESNASINRWFFNDYVHFHSKLDINYTFFSNNHKVTSI